ncbi:MAG: PHP domain-containing protein [Thermodesulfobacteriota bacterium]|nr:PHP domain-containing protein [Thermodesulfobacteriota bacterium]
MKIDLHCHSKYSGDNYFEPEELIEQAIKMNLDGVCFTEHSSLLDFWVIENIKVPKGFYVFRGIELSTSHGHLLVYGLKEESWDAWYRHNYLDLFRVLESVHHHGGICVPAHPFRGWDSFGENLLKIDGFDAIETHNGLDSEDKIQKAIQAADMKKLPSIGGSDCHSTGQVGRAFTEFKNPVCTLEELLEEIKKGNCKGMTL